MRLLHCDRHKGEVGLGHSCAFELDGALFGVSSFKGEGALGTREQKVFCFLERGDSEIARDSGKSFQKVFERFSAFEVTEKSLDAFREVREFRQESHDF